MPWIGVWLNICRAIYGEDLTPGQSLVVGDTPHDADGAHAADMACVGVASHNFTADQLRAGGADWVIESLVGGLPEQALA